MKPSTAFLAASLVTSAACRAAAPASGQGATPVYNRETGKLEQLVSDTNGDGTPDTRAIMDGAAFRHVEIDRDHDGRADRWEYYDEVGARAAGPARVQIQLARAEEANGATARVTRREFYQRGTIARVEEDSDDDGRIDKWERYERGALVQMDLDLAGHGRPDRRLVYGAGGQVDRVEGDADGDGRFEPLPAPADGRRAAGQKGTGS